MYVGVFVGFGEASRLRGFHIINGMTSHPLSLYNGEQNGRGRIRMLGNLNNTEMYAFRKKAKKENKIRVLERLMGNLVSVIRIKVIYNGDCVWVGVS